jgi:arginine-tRNA-protein transferase
MNNDAKIRFFITDAHPCSYLANEQASTLFIDPEHTIDEQLYSQLSRNGFRRSGSHIYRPHCNACEACIPIRTVCGEFTPNRRMKRIANRNNDLNVAIVKNIDRDEHFAIYERYVNMRHIDGDMYPATRAQYDGFLSSEWDVTQFIEYRLGGKLIGAAVTDILDDGFAAIYTYFDPDHEQRSLGVFSILAQIKLCKEMGLPFVYLGYWIKACKKMSYKIEYRPAQVRIDERWLTLT